jgi:hypothetical protein
MRGVVAIAALRRRGRDHGAAARSPGLPRSNIVARWLRLDGPEWSRTEFGYRLVRAARLPGGGAGHGEPQRQLAHNLAHLRFSFFPDADGAAL